MALRLFFDCLSDGPVSINSKLLARDTWGSPQQPFEITAVLSASDQEREHLVKILATQAPQASAITELLPKNLALDVTIRGVSTPQGGYAFVSKVHIEGSPQNAITLIEVSDSTAAELANREFLASDLRSTTETIQRLHDHDELIGHLTRERQTVAPAYIHRFRGSNPLKLRTQEATERYETFMNTPVPTSDLAERLKEFALESEQKADELNTRELPDTLRTISGQETSIPNYIHNILAAISETQTKYLGERRRQIGRAEAGQLLNLKLARGGLEKLSAVQSVIEGLLGVSIDAFSDLDAGSARKRLEEPELDVDGFLVQVNGAGVREALRIVLDYELTRPDILMVEEPEVHLHPALEENLMHYLQTISETCQIFLTTHSTNFVDGVDCSNIIFTEKGDSGTKTTSLTRSEAETLVPQDLGIRLSSLFMHDRVVFVEGKTDEDIIRAWSQTLGFNLASKNVGFIQIGGVRNMFYFASQQILNLLSRRRVQAFFLADRDEKTDEEVSDFTKRLSDNGAAEENILVLPGRQIENLLLNATAISRHIQSLTSNKATPDEVQIRLDEAADQLQADVSLRTCINAARLEAEIRKHRLNLKSCKDSHEIATQISNFLNSAQNIGTTIKELQENTNTRLEKEWKLQRHNLAPGSLVLDRTYKNWGLRYRKTRDGGKLASAFHTEEVRLS